MQSSLILLEDALLAFWLICSSVCLKYESCIQLFDIKPVRRPVKDKSYHFPGMQELKQKLEAR